MPDVKLNCIDKNSTLLLFWWYWPLYYVLLYSVFPSRAVVVMRYIVLILIFIASLENNKWRLNIRFVMFLLLYLIITSFNLILVTYKYEVLIESLTSLLAFITPIYLFSTKDFVLSNFIDRSFKWAISHTSFTLLAIFLAMTNIIGSWSYGNVATVTVANIIILIYGLLVDKTHNKIKILITLVINSGALLVFGSRMPILASVVVSLILAILSFEKKPILKTCVFIILSILALGVLNYYREILSFIINTLNNYGIYSRALTILARDIGTISLVDMMQSSGREDVWPIAIDVIKTRVGFPGGFGVIRHLTNGRINYSHNLFLDLGVVLGASIIPLFIMGMIRIRRMKQYLLKRERMFFITCFIFFIVTSLTGAYFLEDRYAIISWGLIFFYQGGYTNHCKGLLTEVENI